MPYGCSTLVALATGPNDEEKQYTFTILQSILIITKNFIMFQVLM